MASKLIKFFAVLAGLQFLFVIFLFLVVKDNPVFHAVFGMALGLYILWIILGGLLMKKFRSPVRLFIQSINLDWRLKFVLFATILALIEEAITTAMTNTAPLYGVSMAMAHITASANYWDVVLTNSVVLFIPMFCVWAWLLSRYEISTNTVFILWGLTGWFMETINSGFSHWLEIGAWVFIYGLMIYLPAYSVPVKCHVRKLNPWLYPVIVFVVILVGIFVGGLVATIIKSIRPPHFFPGIK